MYNSNIGFNVHQSGSDSFFCKAYHLSFVYDVPAKAAVLNFIQFNEYYGCSKCKQEGRLIHSLQLYSHELIINLQAAESVAVVRAARVLFMCILI